MLRRDDADAPEPIKVKRPVSPWATRVSVIVLGFGLATFEGAAAQPSAAPAPGRPAKQDPAQIALDPSRPDALAEGLAALERAAPLAKKAAPRVEELLSKGLPPDLAIAAIRALSTAAEPRSSAAIAPYVQHRKAEVRKAAAAALGRTGGQKAAAALSLGLRSTDPEVRKLAALGLGAVGDRQSAVDLLRALDRGVSEAAPSIAALCSASGARATGPHATGPQTTGPQTTGPQTTGPQATGPQVTGPHATGPQATGTQTTGPQAAFVLCGELLARWDRIPADVRRAALEAMLRRKPALADGVLLAAVEKATASEGAAAKAYFQGLKGSFKGSAKVRAALDAAARSVKQDTQRALQKGGSP